MLFSERSHRAQNRITQKKKSHQNRKEENLTRIISFRVSESIY